MEAIEKYRLPNQCAIRETCKNSIVLSTTAGDRTMSGGSLRQKGISRCPYVAASGRNNATAVYRAVLNGHGIALVSHLLALEDIQKGRLQALMPEFPPRSFALSVVYPSRRNLPPRTRAVIEFLAEVVRADPAMSNLDVIANEAQESEVPGEQSPRVFAQRRVTRIDRRHRKLTRAIAFGHLRRRKLDDACRGFVSLYGINGLKSGQPIAD